MQKGMKGKQHKRNREKDWFHIVIGACLTKILGSGEQRANSGLPLPVRCSHQHVVDAYVQVQQKKRHSFTLSSAPWCAGNLLENKDLSHFNSKSEKKKPHTHTKIEPVALG